MTDSTGIAAALQAIADTSSTKAKGEMLAKALAAHPDHLPRVIAYAYSPEIMFGVRQVPDVDRFGVEDFSAETYSLLDRLASRQLTGHAALDAIRQALGQLNGPSAQLLRNIIGKDLRAGFAETTIQKVYPGLLPVAPYMRCSLPSDVKFEEWEWAEGVYSQIKADGLFANLNYDGEIAWLTSRSGKPLQGAWFDSICEQAQSCLAFGTQTHGEIVVLDASGIVLPREVGNGIVNSVAQGGEAPAGYCPVYKAWDQIPLSRATSKGRYGEDYCDRFAALVVTLKALKPYGARQAIQVIETRIVHSLREAYEHYADALNRGEEGTIVKRPTMPWRDTGSSGERGQVKLKLEAPCELVIVGFVPGKKTGKHAKTFGSLLCESSDGLLRVAVSGLTDDLRAKIHANREWWLGKIITVTFNAILYSKNLSKKAHSLFLPRYTELREDRTSPDSFERVVAQYANALALASATGCKPPAPRRRIVRPARNRARA